MIRGRHILQVLVIFAMLAAITGGVVMADSPGGEGELVTSVRFTKADFEKLVGQMSDLAELLAKTKPREAMVLRQAVSEAQRAFIANDMEKVAKLLSKGLDSAALQAEDNVTVQLKHVLDILRHEIVDPKALEKRIEAYKAALKQVDELIKQQKPLASKSWLKTNLSEYDKEMNRISAALDALRKKQQKMLAECGKLQARLGEGEKLSKLIDALRQISKKQTAMSGKTQEAPAGSLAVLAAGQKSLKKDMDNLLSELRKAVGDKDVLASLAKAGKDAKSLTKCSDAAGKCASSMKSANDAMLGSDRAKSAKAQQAAQKHLDDAIKALAGEVNQAAKALAPKQGELAKQAKALAGDMNKLATKSRTPDESPKLVKSASHMDNASRHLGQTDCKQASQEMRKALEALDEKAYRIAQLRDTAKKQAAEPSKKQSGEQGKLASDASRTAKAMGGSKGDGLSGEESVSKAAGSMKSAAGKLSAGKAGGANADQEKALKELEKAREEIKEALAEEEREKKLRDMMSVVAELRKILALQKSVSADTKDVDRKVSTGKPLDRASRLRLGKLAKAQAALAEKVVLVLEKLEDEGRTTVFPAVLGEVKMDMRAAGKRLAGVKTGEVTQDMQAEIAASLESMIDAINKELTSRRLGKGGGGGGGGGGSLVPKLAELKLLWQMQKRIQAATVRLDRRKASGKIAKKTLEEMHRQLSRRQGKVKQMAEDLADDGRKPRINHKADEQW